MKLLRGWVLAQVAVLAWMPVLAEHRNFRLKLEGGEVLPGMQGVPSHQSGAFECTFCDEEVMSGSPGVTGMSFTFDRSLSGLTSNRKRMLRPVQSNESGLLELLSSAMARPHDQDPFNLAGARPEEIVEWGRLYYRRSALGSVQGLRLTDLGTDFASVNVVQQRTSYGRLVGSEWTRRLLDPDLGSRSGILKKVGRQRLFLEFRLSF